MEELKSGAQVDSHPSIRQDQPPDYQSWKTLPFPWQAIPERTLNNKLTTY